MIDFAQHKNVIKIVFSLVVQFEKWTYFAVLQGVVATFLAGSSNFLESLQIAWQLFQEVPHP